MKRIILLCLPLLAILFLSQTLPERATSQHSYQQEILQDSFDQKQALADIRAQIEGREKEPAGDVFENLKILGKMPAGRLLAVMEMGFSRSLGVNCTHCHDPKNWASEVKETKQITREMFAMMGKINSEMLASVENLGGEDGKAMINCTTCHRGQVVPALNMN